MIFAYFFQKNRTIEHIFVAIKMYCVILMTYKVLLSITLIREGPKNEGTNCDQWVWTNWENGF